MTSKEIIVSTIIAVSLLSILAMFLCVGTAKGNPSPTLINAPIESPINQTYATNDIPLSLNVEEHWDWSFPYYPEKINATYFLDSQFLGVNITLPRASTKTLEKGYNCYFSYSSNLVALSNGVHKIEFRIGDLVREDSEFTVNATPPIIQVMSPQETLYKTAQIPLEFKVDKPTLQISCSLDEQQAIPIAGNTTLTQLTEGSHRLRLYVDDTEGNTAISYVVFSVYPEAPQTPLPSPSPSPQSTPTPPAMSASLSESASALNFGNKINFTVTVEGGKEPYTYAWYVDNQPNETSPSPYFAFNALAPGSHHVFVEVRDSQNNSANTLTVAFEVLSTGSSSSPSLSPTQQLTMEPSPTPYPANVMIGVNPFPLMVGIISVAALAAALGLLFYFKKRKGLL